MAAGYGMGVCDCGHNPVNSHWKSWCSGIDMSHDYPKTIAEILDPQMTFKPEALRAVRRFAKSKPWQGTYAERLDKFETLLADLSSCYGIQPPTLSVDGCEDGDSGRSCFIPAVNTIILRGHLSVVTFLHEFEHVLGKDEREACRWSVNLFRRCFPKSWAKCEFDGHMIRSHRRES
jgi:hypothetical protein